MKPSGRARLLDECRYFCGCGVALGFMCDEIDPNIILCQTRHELLRSGELVMDPAYQRSWGRNTQDAWIWQSPIRVPNADFELGTFGV